MNDLEIMWTFSWTGRCVHNMVFIMPTYNSYNLQNFEDNIDCFALYVLTVTLYTTSLGGFSPASILKLLNPKKLKHNLNHSKHSLDLMCD